MQALAIVYYERLMPGSQLVNRLQDANYRVLAFNRAHLLFKSAQQETPMILFAELGINNEVLAVVEKIKADPISNHIPIIGFAPDNNPALLAAAQKSGVDLAVNESALLNHLPQLIEQALHIE
jgi:CheY-like chemotaxis protein